MKTARSSGFAGYAFLTLWFLVMWMAPARAEGVAVMRAIDLMPTLEQALIDYGAPAGAEIELDAPMLEFAVAAGETPKVTAVSYSAASGNFVVRLAAATGAAPFSISGRAIATLTLPTLVRHIARGEEIREADIQWTDIKGARANFYVAEAGDLVGKTPRRPLRAGEPLRANDLVAPVAIRRGDLVTMVIETPGMRLTHRAVAMQSGALGDMIDVKNAASERTVRGVVASGGVVRVAGPQHYSMLER